MFSKLYALANITFKEGLRNKAFYGISVFVVLLLFANTLLSQMMMQSGAKFASDMSLSVVLFSGLLVVLFIGVSLLSKDIDKRTIYMVLSKPISRSEYIYGKYIGICAIIAVCVVIVAFFGFLSLYMVKVAVPGFFSSFDWFNYFIASFYIYLMLIILVACSFFYASFSSNSFLVLVLTVVTYLIGSTLSKVIFIIESSEKIGINVSNFTVKLITFASYVFPNFTVFDFKLQAGHGLSLDSTELFVAFLYGVVYIAVMLFLSVYVFRRRQFP